MKTTNPLLLFLISLLFVACESENDDGTETGVPVLRTSMVTGVTADTAVCGGNITDDGGSPVIARGVCWSNSPNPTVENDKSDDGEGAGQFRSYITGYSADTKYYVRAYATNSTGTGYGDQETFRYIPPNGTFLDLRDNHEYKWVRICNRVWMAENLAFLPAVSPPTIESYTEPIFYVNEYNDTSVSEAMATENYKTYGVLYNWLAAMNGCSGDSTSASPVKGICPDGWHMPKDADWTELVDSLGGVEVAADKLREKGIGHWPVPNAGASNTSGFTALPGGFRSDKGRFGTPGFSCYLWSASESGEGQAWFRSLYMIEDNKYKVNRYEGYYGLGFSVRCIRDN
ncbi:MAG: fibrobacter succinogenes major paralogous domain-containing protein [Bacteroidales bacterium]|nr:fibrobacter succinogenes major paralogous domain-containing protein [Bacteroidales bacterium]